MSKELEAREKFDYFLVGLSFAVLAAAIQTARFPPHQKLATILEIFSWAAFIATAIIGIKKIKLHESEWFIYEARNEMDNSLTEQLKMYKVQSDSNIGPEKNLFEELKAFKEGKYFDSITSVRTAFGELVNRVQARHEKAHQAYTRAFEILFMFALILLAVSRGLEPIKQVIREFK